LYAIYLMRHLTVIIQKRTTSKDILSYATKMNPKATSNAKR
jgi:hypothetical protein